MEIVLAFVGLWLLLACVLSWVVGHAVELGDRAWREALWLEEQREPDWNFPARCNGDPAYDRCVCGGIRRYCDPHFTPARKNRAA